VLPSPKEELAMNDGFCDGYGEEPSVMLEQCPECGRNLCERCWGDRTIEICHLCSRGEPNSLVAEEKDICKQKRRN